MSLKIKKKTFDILKQNDWKVYKILFIENKIYFSEICILNLTSLAIQLDVISF